MIDDIMQGFTKIWKPLCLTARCWVPHGPRVISPQHPCQMNDVKMNLLKSLVRSNANLFGCIVPVEDEVAVDSKRSLIPVKYMWQKNDTILEFASTRCPRHHQKLHLWLGVCDLSPHKHSEIESLQDRVV